MKEEYTRLLCLLLSHRRSDATEQEIDAILDQMDNIWWKLSDDERKELQELSQKLNERLENNGQE